MESNTSDKYRVTSEVDNYMKLDSKRGNLEESAYNKLSFPEVDNYMKLGSKRGNVEEAAYNKLSFPEVDNYMTLGSIRPNLKESTYNKLSFPEESKSNGSHQRRTCLIVSVVFVVLAVIVTAVCLGLFIGKNTETDNNECQCNPCLNGATCNNLVKNYTCACAPGYSGTTCEQNINECQSNPCLNGATCNDIVNGYAYTCAPGYTGTACEQDINECQSNPCLNGATCNDLVNGYSCVCAPGYIGITCQLAYTGPSVLMLRNDVNGSDSYFFNRSWAQFKQEFGSPTSRYWIGLDRLHEVSQGSCKIRFDLQLLNGSSYFAQYSNFSVGGLSSNYKLTIGGYSGDAGDAMFTHNGLQFTTYDFSNYTRNCARDFGGGFWFKDGGLAFITTSPARNT